MKTIMQLAVSFAIIALLSSCSLSYSSGKSNESSKSSSNSSLSSSDNYVAKTQYLDDISEYVATVIVSNLSDDDYMAELGTIAERHCITDWERDEATYRAIGMGFRQAGISKTQVLKTKFVSDVSQTDQNKLKLILTGYHS
jgi:hypothetical protein